MKQFLYLTFRYPFTLEPVTVMKLYVLLLINNTGLAHGTIDLKPQATIWFDKSLYLFVCLECHFLCVARNNGENLQAA